MEGRTPIHYCLNDAKIADSFLNYLAEYPPNYNACNLTKLVPLLILKGLQKTIFFLDSRFKSTPLLETFDRERINILKEANFALTSKNTFWL